MARRSSPPAPAHTRRRTFDREQIIAAIQRWNEQYGQHPLWIDWEPARARAKGQTWRAERFEASTWPTVRMGRRHFPTLGDAIAAAGLIPPTVRGRKANLTDSGQVLRALREWTRRHGEPPTQTDLDPYRAERTRQQWRIDRYQAGDWPSLQTVRHHFGTLTGAIAAAGLEAAPRGESTAERLSRRRRNRLALIEHVALTGADHGPDALASAIRAVAGARKSGDQQCLDSALLTLAGTALGWSDGMRRTKLCSASATPQPRLEDLAEAAPQADTRIR